MQGIERDRVELVARIYKSNQEAARILGITEQSFGRLCRKHGIETPYARQTRGRQAGATSPSRRRSTPTSAEVR